MAEHDQQFDSYEQWKNKARSWLTRHEMYDEYYFRALCIDAKGRVCRNGGDMMRARDEDAFPVRWWWPDQEIGELNTHKANQNTNPGSGGEKYKYAKNSNSDSAWYIQDDEGVTVVSVDGKEAYVALLTDALNIKHATGLPPSELFAHGKDLLSALRMVAFVLSEGQPGITDTIWAATTAPETLLDYVERFANSAEKHFNPKSKQINSEEILS